MYNPSNPFPEEMIRTQPSEAYPPMEELPLKPSPPQYAVQPPPQAPNAMSTQPPQAQPAEVGESAITGREDALTIKFAIGKLNDYLLWFLMVLEVTLLVEFFLMLIGAAQNNLFAGFMYALTVIPLYPLLVSCQVRSWEIAVQSLNGLLLLRWLSTFWSSMR